MKKTAIIFFFSILLISCQKEEFPPNPEWLNAKIDQMETSPAYAGATVSLFEWKSEHYYLISNPIFSCIMCEFYSYQGDKFQWTEDKINDFQANGKRIKTVWERGFTK